MKIHTKLYRKEDLLQLVPFMRLLYPREVAANPQGRGVDITFPKTEVVMALMARHATPQAAQLRSMEDIRSVRILDQGDVVSAHVDGEQENLLPKDLAQWVEEALLPEIHAAIEQAQSYLDAMRKLAYRASEELCSTSLGGRLWNVSTGTPRIDETLIQAIDVAQRTAAGQVIALKLSSWDKSTGAVSHHLTNAFAVTRNQPLRPLAIRELKRHIHAALPLNSTRYT
ncbi:MAG: hypothetical protein K8D98_00215 [Rhodanobacter sp.]|nr:hypothetical protein [Rhodanobacter sp.]